ncbi:hypothetical protein GQ53DRAFT_406503 [Thozetella sp. PMI_491]|nr:hypothetical protein GQ53DRAFT_406503 [Thozetella sp. PMI_491]
MSEETANITSSPVILKVSNRVSANDILHDQGENGEISSETQSVSTTIPTHRPPAAPRAPRAYDDARVPGPTGLGWARTHERRRAWGAPPRVPGRRRDDAPRRFRRLFLLLELRVATGVAKIIMYERRGGRRVCERATGWGRGMETHRCAKNPMWRGACQCRLDCLDGFETSPFGSVQSRPRAPTRESAAARAKKHQFSDTILTRNLLAVVGARRSPTRRRPPWSV